MAITPDQESNFEAPFGLAAHPVRRRVLGEIHSRPFQLTNTPRTILQLAFTAESGDFAPHARALAAVLQRHGMPLPAADTRHVSLNLGMGRLRWERYTEFSSWTFDAPGTARLDDMPERHVFSSEFISPGPLISATRLDLIGEERSGEIPDFFNPTSLSYSEMDGGLAAAATDFRQDGNGFTRIVVIDRGLGPARAGALTQRLVEIETYRTLALLGLPEAQRLAPKLGRIEAELARIAAALHAGTTESANLLDEMIALSAELEADSVASLYRFGASRAYDEIVSQRLEVLQETPIHGYETWGAFLNRRQAPAMRTCRTVSGRQEMLSEKLARAADLLRTRVDVELERQNRDVLRSMNRRAKLQLRLQQTVEGLSVAAVSYYVVGLISYLAHGAENAGAHIDPTIAAAVSVPLVVLLIALVVRRIRRRNGE